MVRIALAALAVAMAAGNATAQPAGQATPPDAIAVQTPEIVVTQPPGTTTSAQAAQNLVDQFCARDPTVGRITALELEFFKRCQDALKVQQEILKLEQETRKLENDNANSVLSTLLAFGPLFGAVLALIPVLIGYAYKNDADKRLLNSEAANQRAEQRERHTRELMKELTSSRAAEQSYAAAGLFALIRDNVAQNANRSKRQRDDVDRQNAHREAVAVMSGLLARLRDEELGVPEAKFIADEAGKVFREQASLKDGLRMKQFNLQQVVMRDAYWKEVDASGVDFYGAVLSNMSFKMGNLRGAVFYNADLREAVFEDANAMETDFRGANLSGANLKGANFTGARNLHLATFDAATQWDEKTTWPEGFVSPRVAD